MPDPRLTSTAQARRPRADAERNRLRLLEAARAAFAAGTETVTLDQVARDAGVGIGTLYRHFPTREALVEALYRKELAELCAGAGELLAGLPPQRALRAWMDQFADFVAAKQGMTDALRAARAAGAVSVPQAREEMTTALRPLLGAGVRDGTLRGDIHPEDVVALILGSLTTTSVTGSREQLARLFDLLLDAFRAPGADGRGE